MRKREVAGLWRPGPRNSEGVISGKTVDNSESKRASGMKGLLRQTENPPIAGWSRAAGFGDGHEGNKLT
jgi:hypothetical protein